jgi:hypothetical protein
MFVKCILVELYRVLIFRELAVLGSFYWFKFRLTCDNAQEMRIGILPNLQRVVHISEPLGKTLIIIIIIINHNPHYQ